MAAQGELTSWTVAVISKAGSPHRDTLGRHKFCPRDRSPEGNGENPPAGWIAPRDPSDTGLFATVKGNIQELEHHSLDLETMTLDDSMLAALLSKRSTADSGPLFSSDEQEELCRMAEGRKSLRDAALALTKMRLPPRSGEPAKDVRVPNGQVTRELRPATHGLLLIYPLWPKLPESVPEYSPTNPPFIGIVLSFPASHTARAVEYKVNKVWQAELRDQDYED
jgi:hypothetical protein